MEEKYFEILNKIKEAKLDSTTLYLLDCIYNGNEDKELALKQAKYAREVWIDSDTDLPLSRLADVVVENWELIEVDEMTDEEIIEECVGY